MDLLNNREIAILFWLIAFLFWACSKREIRESFKAILQHALDRMILTFLFIFYAYSVFTVWCLRIYDISYENICKFFREGASKNALIRAINMRENQRKSYFETK